MNFAARGQEFEHDELDRELGRHRPRWHPEQGAGRRHGRGWPVFYWLFQPYTAGVWA